MPTPVAYALTTEQRVKDKLAITVSGFDTVIKRLMYGVTDVVEKITQRRFLQTTYANEVYDGAPLLDQDTIMMALILRNAPVTTLSAFEYNAGTKSNPIWTTFYADNYQEINDKGIIMVPGGLPRGMQNIRASYIAGYKIDFANEFDSSLHTLPYDLAELADRLVIRQLKKRDAEGKLSEVFGESQITWKELLDPFDLQILANYSRPRFV